jgi:membrane protein implicated in regulation of membrane protease activity
MDALIEWVWDVSFWHWWALAGLLIAIEVMTPTTYLLWPAISAAVIGAIVALIGPFDWRLQMLAFALLSIAIGMVWARLAPRRQAAAGEERLNNRGQSYLGRRLHLTRGLPDGRGQVQIDDSWWTAKSADGAPLENGALVEVVGNDGTVLILKPV